jgi:protein gp37
MAETAIEWTERSWNPIVGCTVVSPGCTNCYAMKMADRLEAMAPKPNGEGNPHLLHYRGTTTRGQFQSKPPVWTGKVAMAPDHVLLEPLRRRTPTTWFVNSMGDLFHEAVPDEWIDRVFAVMALCPQHTFQVLTKRSARMRQYMLEQWQGTPARTISLGHGETLNIPAGGPTGRVGQIEEACEPLLEQLGLVDTTKDELWTEDGKCKAMQWSWPLPNVWLGVSAEDQKRADERIPDLLATPAAIRFVSAEPLLGPIDFTEIMHAPGHALHALWGLKAHTDGTASYGAKIDWIIVGGESGPEARPMHPDWARQIRDQCAAAGTAFFFKQWGEWKHLSDDEFVSEAAEEADVLGRYAYFPAKPASPQVHMVRLGKKRAGRLLDGVQHDGMPEIRR